MEDEGGLWWVVYSVDGREATSVQVQGPLLASGVSNKEILE